MKNVFIKKIKISPLERGVPKGRGVFHLERGVPKGRGVFHLERGVPKGRGVFYLERGVPKGRGVFFHSPLSLWRSIWGDFHSPLTFWGGVWGDFHSPLSLWRSIWGDFHSPLSLWRGAGGEVRTCRVVALSLILFLFLISSLSSATEPEADSLSVYKTPSVTVTADRAELGKTPIPFMNLTQSEIQQIYTVQDVPELLTELPSVITYSEGGNSIGYSYLTMRGFSQHRISVFVNGIPQNDPEDHNVYWIDMPDIASNVENIQVQRGAGLVNYGAASIGGSINLTTSNFANQKGVKLFSGIGYQEYGAGGLTKYQPTMSKFSLELASGMVGKYAVYSRLSRINSSGYRDNMWSELNSFFLSAARFDDNFTTQINIFGGPLGDGLGYTGLPKEYINDLSLRRSNPVYWEYNATGDTVSYFVPRRKQEVEGFSQPHYELLNDWYVNDNLTFHSSLFFYTGDGYFDYSGAGWADGYWWDGVWYNGPLKDWMSNDYKYQADTLSTKNSMLRGFVGNKQGGWIPRINWKHDGGELSAGAEIRFHRSEHWGKIIYSELYPVGIDGMSYDPDYKFYLNNGERDIFSLFASEHYKLTDKLTLSLDGQLVRQSYRLANIKKGNEYMEFLQSDGTNKSAKGALFEFNYLFLNPRIGINYIIDDNMNVYALGAFTSREPRMKNLFSAEEAWSGAEPQFELIQINDSTMGYDFTSSLVKPESMLDIELGWNYGIEDFNIGVNAYWMEYSDELVSTGIVDVWGRPVDGNIPRTRHIGLELQGAIILMNNSDGQIKLSANATFSQNRIVEFDFVTLKYNDDYVKIPADTVSLNGKSIAGFPDLMAGLRLSYSLEDFYCSLSGRYAGEFRTDNFGDLITDSRIQNHLATTTNVYRDNLVDAYFLLNLDLSYTLRNVLSLQSLKVQARVNNVLNQLYAAYGIGKTFFPAAERNIFVGIELGL